MPITFASSWASAPATLPTDRHAAIADIQTELVLHLPRSLFQGGVGQTSLSATLNAGAINSGVVAGPVQTLNVRINNCFIDPFDPDNPTAARSITHSNTGATLGTLQLYGMNGSDYCQLSLTLGNLADDYLFSSIAYDFDLVIERADRIDEVYYDLNAKTNGRMQLYLRPMATAPSNLVFVNNAGFAGGFSFRRSFFLSSGSPAGARAFFVGMLKRSKMNSTAAALTAADVVCGMLVNGSSAAIIINGTPVWARSDLPQIGKLEMLMEAWTTNDMSHPVSVDLDSISYDFSTSYICADAVDFDTITPFDGATASVSFADAVFADIQDLDFTGTDGYYFAANQFRDNYGAEPLFGLTYPAAGEVVFSDDMLGGAILAGSVAETGQQWNPSGDSGIVMDGQGTYPVTGGLRSIDNAFVFPAGPFSLEFTVVNSPATSGVSLYTLGVGGTNPGSSIQLSGGVRLRHPGGNSPMVVDEFTDAGPTVVLPGGITRVAGAQVHVEYFFDGTNVSVYIDNVLFYGPIAPNGTLAGKALRLLGNCAGSGTDQRARIKDIKFTSLEAPPVPPFWTNLIMTLETP